MPMTYLPSETPVAVEKNAVPGVFDATGYYTRGNAPRRLWDYLAYPRVLFTFVLCFLALVLHIAFGIYVWFYQ